MKTLLGKADLPQKRGNSTRKLPSWTIASFLPCVSNLLAYPEEFELASPVICELVLYYKYHKSLSLPLLYVCVCVCVVCIHIYIHIHTYILPLVLFLWRTLTDTVNSGELSGWGHISPARDSWDLKTKGVRNVQYARARVYTAPTAGKGSAVPSWEPNRLNIFQSNTNYLY